MRVLAIMCHPDDMEFHCGGTLLKYKSLGSDVFCCHAANGNMGHTVIKPDELKKIRLNEAKNAGKIGGIEMISADIDDLTLNSSDQRQVDKIIKVIRYVNPDVIITHNPEDYCSDHTEVSKLVLNASFSATCPQFKPELGSAAKLTPIFFADNDSGINFIPHEYVDITEFMRLKADMLMCHKSQLVWLSEHDDIDAAEQIRKKAAFYGLQCGVEYAEAFRIYRASERMRTYRVLP